MDEHRREKPRGEEPNDRRGKEEEVQEEDEEGEEMQIMDNKEEDPMLAPRRSKRDVARAESGQKDDDGDDEMSVVELSKSLTPNTYSIIYIADPQSKSFAFGIMFFLFQTAFPVLALADLIDGDSDSNMLRAPPDVSRYVRAAGYLAVALSVPLFQDTLDSIEKMHEGYHVVVTKQTPHATYW